MMKNKHIPKPEYLGCVNAAPVKAGFSTPVNVVGILASIEKRETKETSMYKDERTEAQQAKDYLVESLRQHMAKKKNEARDHFNIGKRAITNLGDLRKAVKKGWFTLDKSLDQYADEYGVLYWQDYIIVQNPDKPVDHDAYNADVKEIDKAANEVQDQIIVFGPEKGLEALNAFKAKTFH